MRSRLALLALTWAACTHSAARAPLAPPAAEAGPPPASAERAAAVPDGGAGIDFARDVQPLLEARCRPCHFAGGKLYARLPFDRPETIRELGTALFTRLEDPESRALLQRFLDSDAR